MKILIVDDSDVDRKLLASTLVKAGVKNEIVQAQDGKEALEILESQYNDLCITFLDWQMPRIDGLEVLKQIARNPNTSAMPVVMLTSATSPDSEELAQMLNPNLKAFLMKPLNPEKVSEVALAHIK